MVEELLQARDPSPFERFFFRSTVSSLLVTSLLHADAVWGVPRSQARASVSGEYVFACFGPWVDEGALPIEVIDIAGGIRIIVRSARVERMGSDVLFGAELPVLTAPLLPYPKMLANAGIHGRVVVRALVDTLGNVEPGTATVVRSRHPVLDAVAIRAVLKTQFYQARIDRVAGEAVVEVPVDFILPD